jgi:xylulokinase
MLWLDRRAVTEAREIGELWGRPVAPWYFLPKALWIARREPAVYEATEHLLSCPEFLCFHLTGNAFTVLHTEAFVAYYWDDAVLRRLGLERELFPPFLRPGQPMGGVSFAASAELGLPSGVPVIAGGPDYLMSLVGTGTVAPGRACDRAGSSEGINLCAEAEVRDPRLLCRPHLVEPFWNVAGMIPASGLAVSWIRSVAGGWGDSYEAFFDSVASVPAGARGLLFLPFLGPGGAGAFAGLGLQHGREEMARAVVEAVGFAIRDIVLTMRENGLRVESMALTGGQARVERWAQIKADMTGLEIGVPRVADAELVGAAVVGFVALGVHAGVVEAAERMVVIARVFTPDPRTAAFYAELHGWYRDLARLAPEEVGE